MAVHSVHVASATVKAAIPTVHPAVTVYSQNFDNVSYIGPNPDSWASVFGAISGLNGSAGLPHSSPYLMAASTAASSAGAKQVGRTVTGLTVGRSYTFTAWAIQQNIHASAFTIGVTGISTNAGVSASTWTQLTYTFTATATSHQLILGFTADASISFAAWDDIALVRNSYLTMEDFPLDLENGKMTLDDSWAPYVQGTLVCFAPDQAYIESIDPYDALRVSVTLSQDFGTGTEFNPVARTPVTRTFDLSLKANAVDHNAGEMTLTLESDEALLRAWTKLTTTSERIYGLSVKDAVTYALAKIGATLQAGAADATLTAKPLEPPYTNLHPNPNVATAITGFVTGGSNGTTVRSTGLVGGPVPGITTYTHSAWTGASGTGSGGIFYSGSPTIPVTPGQQYTYGAWVRSSVNQTVTVNVQWTGTTPNTIGSDQVLLANTWTWVEQTFTAIAASTSAAPYIYPKAGFQWVSGNTFDTLGWVFVAGSDAPATFDGSNKGNRDTNLYTVAWTGTANASSSTLTNIANTDALIWLPGVTAWDWVSPLVAAGGLRLFCDEQRRWYLVSSVILDGVVTLSPDTGIERATDSRSLEDQSDFYTGVLISYQAPSDPVSGLTPAPVYDVAGTQGRVLYIQNDTASPGPGAAAAILARATGKGRVLSVTNESNYATTPGMALTITLPDTPTQSGSVSSVQWSFPEARMTVGSKGLTDTPANAWIFAAGAWSAATGTWAAATGTN